MANTDSNTNPILNPTMRDVSLPLTLRPMMDKAKIVGVCTNTIIELPTLILNLRFNV